MRLKAAGEETWDCSLLLCIYLGGLQREGVCLACCFRDCKSNGRPLFGHGVDITVVGACAEEIRWRDRKL